MEIAYLGYILVFKIAFMSQIPQTLTISGLLGDYRAGKLTPLLLITALLQRIETDSHAGIWISMAEQQKILDIARQQTELLSTAGETALANYPLLGIPFAVKDNIDVRGMATTAACPAYAYESQESAEAVARLERAGAILIGKTNLDQFATGLVGTRSPYGAVENPFDERYVSGGSSSGSAVAVARGFTAFALGTDTAGSGRVPAGFCNLVGIKPTPGLVSTRGVRPACRSLDCVSILAHTVHDAWSVLSIIAGVDPGDSYSHAIPALGPLLRKVRIAVPARPEFCGDASAQAAFNDALGKVRDLPHVSISEIDFGPLHEVAKLLYDGPWVAERRAALGEFFDTHGAEIDAVVRSVIGRADSQNAVDAFNGIYQLEAAKRYAESLFSQVDVLLVPTAPTHYTIAELAEEPLLRNSHMGIYTNFVNLLDMSALALPGGFRNDGLPAGITLIGACGADHRLAELARSLEPHLHLRLGLGHEQPPRGTLLPPLPDTEPAIRVAVVGAHLRGQPLNWQLAERSARLIRSTRTAKHYRLYALPGTTPPKPGLVRSETEGVAIEVEIWEMPARHYGSFVAEIPSPLGIGTLELEDGSKVQGFICESWALADAEDISRFGGWRDYRASVATQ
ncbi:allophanate hydrolase [soil metagenome]